MKTQKLLLILSFILELLGVLIIFSSIYTLQYTFNSQILVLTLGSQIPYFILGFATIAFGELIKLLIKIEQNTRKE